MAATTFTWQPEYGAQLSEEPKVNVTKFGDGYEVRAPEGINSNLQKWNLQFTASSASTPAILTFLRARNAVEAFNWTTPLNEEKVFVARKWKLTRREGHQVLSVDFEEVPE